MAVGSDCGKQKFKKNKIQTRLNFTKNDHGFLYMEHVWQPLTKTRFLSGLHFKIYFVKKNNNIVIQ